VWTLRAWPDHATGTPRNPFLLETSRRVVFAAGDVRSGSIKRVRSGVGEGDMASHFFQEHMKGIYVTEASGGPVFALAAYLFHA
jgi:hypothetical protein